MMTRQQKGTVRQSPQHNKERLRTKKMNKRKSLNKKRQLQEWLKTRLVKSKLTFCTTCISKW